MSEKPEPCGATATFWPEHEGIDVKCSLPKGHEPPNIHCDEEMGEWDGDWTPTSEPDP